MGSPVVVPADERVRPELSTNKGNIMDFMDVIDKLAHRPARQHASIVLPDPMPYENGTDPGYFQLRLSDMALSDDRRWLQEIVPATFFLVDFESGGTTIRQPYFVSNQLLTMMPEGVDPNRLRVRFRDTLVTGPTPYAGGDVGLFVGLFQSAIEDRRETLFSVFETLFGGVDLGQLSQYVKVAEKLSDAIFRCLGGSEMKCLLAERKVIGQHMLPARGYVAYLCARKGNVDTSGLEVREGTLQRRVGDTVSPVQDLDYCLVRIELLAFRNDYGQMGFNEVLRRARDARRSGSVETAQVLLLECARQIDASNELSAKQKAALIESSAAELYATPIMNRPPQEVRATRDGAPSPIWQIQDRAQRALGNDYDEELLSPSFHRISQLTTRLTQSPPLEGPLYNAELVARLKQASTEPEPPPSGLLVKALEAGSIIG
jgi:hypothetical protein